MRGKTMKKNREQRRAERNATRGTATPLREHTTIADARSSQNTIRVAAAIDLLTPNLNAAIRAAATDAIENIERSTRAAKAAHREHARLTDELNAQAAGWVDMLNAGPPAITVDSMSMLQDPDMQSPTPKVIDRSLVREIFLKQGFKIQEGQSDLKEYVYEAAHALLAHVNAVVTPSPTPGTRPYAKADDPFLDYYDKPVWEMGLRQYDNDALANAAFLHYDDDTLTSKMIAHMQRPDVYPKPPFTRIMLMTAVKERLRWLDRQLRKVTWERDQALAELQMSTLTQQQDEQPAPTMPAATTKGVQEAYVPYSSEHTVYHIGPQQAPIQQYPNTSDSSTASAGMAGYLDALVNCDSPTQEHQRAVEELRNAADYILARNPCPSAGEQPLPPVDTLTPGERYLRRSFAQVARVITDLGLHGCVRITAGGSSVDMPELRHRQPFLYGYLKDNGERPRLFIQALTISAWSIPHARWLFAAVKNSSETELSAVLDRAQQDLCESSRRSAIEDPTAISGPV